MGGDAPTRVISRPTQGQQRALEDARRRLVALATDLEPQTADEAALRTTAAALDTVVHRIRWVADVTADDQVRGA